MQVVSNLVEDGCNVQEALDRPRFHYLEGRSVAQETGLQESVGAALEQLGYDVQGELSARARGGFGGGQAIAIDPTTGVYWGGSDEREDGCAIGF